MSAWFLCPRLSLGGICTGQLLESARVKRHLQLHEKGRECCTCCMHQPHEAEYDRTEEKHRLQDLKQGEPINSLIGRAVLRTTYPPPPPRGGLSDCVSVRAGLVGMGIQARRVDGRDEAQCRATLRVQQRNSLVLTYVAPSSTSIVLILVGFGRRRPLAPAGA